MDWKKIVGTVAPTIATALGGPLAGLAVKGIAGAFGLGDDATEEDVAVAVRGATPEQLLALKQAEQTFVLEMRRLDIEVDKLQADDRKDARARAIAQNDWSPQIIGVIILCVWGYVNITLLTMTVAPVLDAGVVGRILGMIDAATLAFLYWLYGSSKGSQVKDATIHAGMSK